MSKLIGYAELVQNLMLEKKQGFVDKVSGSKKERLGLDSCLAELKA